MKICIDAGHGGKDSGATFKGVAEKDITLMSALCLGSLLQAHGHEVVYTRDFDYYVPLNKRAEIANDAKVEAFISLHCNADPDEDQPGDPQAKGEEIWIYPGSQGGHRLAESIKLPVDAIFADHKFRGIKEARFTVLKKTKMPAALIEMGFIDNATEVEKFTNPAVYPQIARLLTQGINDYKI